MSDTIGAHNELHSEQGAIAGEHRGRARNPIIRVADIAWLEFEKPDLDRAEAFARAFGFSVALRTRDELHLRGTDAERRASCCGAAPGRNSWEARCGPATKSTCCGSPTRSESR